MHVAPTISQNIHKITIAPVHKHHYLQYYRSRSKSFPADFYSSQKEVDSDVDHSDDHDDGEDKGTYLDEEFFLID